MNWITSIPDKIMSWYANRHNNTSSFKDMYKGTYFVVLLLLFVMVVMATKVDYTVMSSIVLISTGNYWLAFGMGLAIAIMIQVFIINSGGIVIKIFINRLWSRSHIGQLIIHGSLLIAGFSATIYLSTQTYYSAKAYSVDHKEELLANIKSKTSDHSDNINESTTSIKEEIQSRVDRTNALYDNRVLQKEELLAANIKKYKFRLDASKISEGTFNEKESYYDIKYTGEIAELENERSSKLEELHKEEEEKLAKLNEAHSSKLSKHENESDNEKQALSKAIEQNADITMYWNVFLNIASFLLCIGLLMYAKGVNATPTQSTQEATQNELEEDWVATQNAKMSKKSANSTPYSDDLLKKKHLHIATQTIN